MDRRATIGLTGLVARLIQVTAHGMFEFPDKPEEAEQLSLRLHVDMVRQEAEKSISPKLNSAPLQDIS